MLPLDADCPICSAVSLYQTVLFESELVMVVCDVQHGKDWGWAVWSASELGDADLVSNELVDGFFAFPVPTVQLIMEAGRSRFARVRADGGADRTWNVTSGVGSFDADLDAFRGVLASMAESWCVLDKVAA